MHDAVQHAGAQRHPDTVELPADRCAGLAAPAIDRVFAGAMRATREAGGHDLVSRYGGSDAAGGLVEYRTALAHPGRCVTRDQVRAVAGRGPATGQAHVDAAWTAVEGYAAAGLVEIVDGDRFRATVRGLDFLRELYRLHAEVTGDRWRAHADRVARLVRTTGRMLAAVQPAPGTAVTALAAMTPIHEPAGTPPGVLLLNRLGCLRYHRDDAHRDDRLTAAPYAAVTAEYRLVLLADLAALP